MSRKLIATDTPWESKVEYSRAVCVGSSVHVSGTAGTGAEGELIGGGAYAQASQSLKNIRRILMRAGTRMQDVVRTRIYITNMEDCDDVARAHSEFFRGIRPATTIVEVSGLLLPDMLVEIEAEAVVASQSFR